MNIYSLLDLFLKKKRKKEKRKKKNSFFGILKNKKMKIEGENKKIFRTNIIKETKIISF
jgi:hypothetical protein